MGVHVWSAVFSLAVLLALDTPAQAEKRVALVIGNSAYPASPLDNPVNDAKAMAAKLKGIGFEVILRENTTKAQMEDAIGLFGEKLPADATGLMFYAGHGMQVGGRNYLIPVDAKIASEQRVKLETVDAEVVLDQMAAARARVSLLILDACRNNPYERRWRGGSAGLAQMNAPEGTLIAYATAPGKVAADGETKNGLYTGELLKVLDEPGLPVEEVFKRVRVAVSKASKGGQTPWEASSLTGDLYFVPKGATVTVMPLPPATMDADAMTCEALKGSTNPAGFEEYLRQFPQGRCVPYARVRLADFSHPSQQPVVVSLGGGNKTPGSVFRDCPDCPEITVVPAGNFMMGSSAKEQEWAVKHGSLREWVKPESPQHKVRISYSFGVGKTVVTFAQWDACVASGGCNDYLPRDQGWGRGDQPVINVSWNDALSYIQWLNDKVRSGVQASTGGESGPYRLLTESEWEYAARAGTTTKWSCGDDEACLGGVAWYRSNSGDRTRPAANKSPNAFGLYDMHGNVWEWVEDCHEDSYDGAPSDGGPRQGEKSCAHVVRGGSFSFNPNLLRSASRFVNDAHDRFPLLGFRLARTLY